MNKQNWYYGVVKWFSERGYGFINVDGIDEDIFLHYSDLQMEGYKTIKNDTLVYFQLITNDKGKQQAVMVVAMDGNLNDCFETPRLS